MTQLLGKGVYLICAVIAAHALTFLMLGGLPEPAIAALGIQSGNDAARAAFEQSHLTRSYVQTLWDLASGNLGTTLDGVPVLNELTQGLQSSLPRLALAIAVLAIGTMMTAFASRDRLKAVVEGFRFLAFLPPFAAPFLALPVLLMAASAHTMIGTMASSICIALPAMAILCSQTAEVTQRNLSAPFAVNIRSTGASNARLRVRLLRSLFVELLPTMEKIVSGLLVSLIFVEPVLGLDGFGTLAIRAIRRSDPDMVLALVLVVAITVNIARILAEVGRHHFRLGAQ